MTALGVKEIAELGGVQPDTVRRVIREFIAPCTPYHKRHAWHGAELDIAMTDDGPVVAFASLPAHIREAAVVRDQCPLPLTEPKG